MSAVTIERTSAISSFRTFEEFPHRHIAHAVHDDSCQPIIKPGEVAVITDEEGIYPEDSGWCLIEFSNGKSFRGRERRAREIVEAYQGKDGDWYTRRPNEARTPGVILCVDGPYSDFNYLAEKILGRVVGIDRPPQVFG
jgi:hypothetical protein